VGTHENKSSLLHFVAAIQECDLQTLFAFLCQRSGHADGLPNKINTVYADLHPRKVSCVFLCWRYNFSNREKGKVLRKHGLHGEIAAMVLLKIFTNGN